ncbi:MAG TPA: hypothetical protein VFX49_13930 [Chloroflexota bacterium]|nr:hypothetical protein [Chloroflexota bacterium]
MDQPGRITWQGTPWYLHGANVPWFNWGCDFGCGVSGGVSDPAVRTQVEAGLAKLKDSGVHLARWWVFEGTAWQITRDAAGLPSGIDARVYADLDAALALAEKYDLYYELTLFHGPGNVPAAWLTDSTQRGRLVAALTPLFARYRGHPRVLAYDVMNEPEQDIWNGTIPQAAVQALVREVAAAVHGNSTAYVTVGASMLDGLPLWKGLGLDFYEAHWYDYMSGGNWCARCTDYATVQQRYGLDRPLVIGEFYAGPDTDALQRYTDWRNKGYAGAYAWSVFSDKTQDKMPIDYAAARSFGSAYGDTGPRAGALAQASATPSATAAASATAVPSATTAAAASPTATSAPAATSTPSTTATAVVGSATPIATVTVLPSATAPASSPTATAAKPGRRNGQR